MKEGDNEFVSRAQEVGGTKETQGEGEDRGEGIVGI